MKIAGRQVIRETEFVCDCAKKAKLNLVRVKAEMSHAAETVHYEEFQCPECKKIFHARYMLDSDLKMVCYPIAYPSSPGRVKQAEQKPS